MNRKDFLSTLGIIPILPYLRIRRPSLTTPWLASWGRRKKFSVTSSQPASDTIIEMTVFNTSGTDTTTEVYLDGNIRSDWGDLRFTRGDGTTRLPFAILRRTGTSVKVAVNLGTVQNGDFYIYYDGPASSLFKIANLTDVHYNPGEVLDNRGQSLDFIDSFVERMETYLPDLSVHCGDKIGDDSHNPTNRVNYYQATMDHFAAVASGEIMDGVAPGNHDFDFTSFAQILALHTGDTWMVSGTLYGAKEVGPYLIVSLDANYEPDTQTHMSNTHNGFGYVNTDQLTWFENTLAAATKPVIVFCHQPLSEMDTDQFTLSKAIYHTQNRAAVRAIIEASNKVVCCIHGHTHYSRNDVINGIPYITITNIGNTGQFGEQPATNTGKWGLLDFDASSQVIRVRTEAVVSSSPALIYDQFIPFGRTQFFSDISDNTEEVYALGNNATYEKASFFRDPTQAYVDDDADLYKYPGNLNIPDDVLTDKTIKIVGRNDTPNFGRAQWYFSPRTWKFKIKFSAWLSSTKTKHFKFGSSTVVNSPAFRFHFNNDGNISAHDGNTLTNLVAYATNTWYDVEIIANVSTQTFTVYVDGNLEATDFDFTNSIATINRVEIVTETGNLLVDSMRIENYNDTEITAFQTEQVQ